MERPNSSLVLKSGVDIMKDAIFQEIVTCVESDGIILALLQGSKEERVLQRVVDTLRTVRVLGLTHDVCRVLISRQMEVYAENSPSDTPKSDPDGQSLVESLNQVALQQPNPLANVSLEESVKNALFGEVVQSITKNECSLIMATGLKSDNTLQTALEILENGRIIYLAPDACEVLLVNRMKRGKRKPAARAKTSEKSLAGEKTCHICNKQFSKRSGLLTHQKAFHEKSLPHECDLCDRAFVYPKELRMHRLSHTGERPYRCKICNKGFIARKDVQRHQPVHTGERAFVCATCNATFAHKANLDRHVKSKHEGRRPYVCSLCVDKKYCDRGGLRKHLASIHRIFDVPRKKVVHRMIPREVVDGQNVGQLSNLNSVHEKSKIPDLSQTRNPSQTHDISLVGETVILGAVDMPPSKELPSTSTRVHPEIVHILGETSTVECPSTSIQVHPETHSVHILAETHTVESPSTSTQVHPETSSVHILGETHTMDSPSTSTLVHPETSSVHVLSETHTVESASKILQQLSQNIAELNENQSLLDSSDKINDSRGRTFSFSGNSLVIPSVVKATGDLMASQGVQEETTGAIINIAFTNPSLSGEDMAAGHSGINIFDESTSTTVQLENAAETEVTAPH